MVILSLARALLVGVLGSYPLPEMQLYCSLMTSLLTSRSSSSRTHLMLGRGHSPLPAHSSSPVTTVAMAT